MNKYNNLVIFDLDGVLIDTRDMHFNALNMALINNNYEKISPQDHVAIYDGLPTRKKLEILSEKGKIHYESFVSIEHDKKQYTRDLLPKYVKFNRELVDLFHSIRMKSWQIAVCSNAINETILEATTLLGLKDSYTTGFAIFGTSDVHSPKPHPEIYWRAMMAHAAIPSTTIILEDSHVGRVAAKESGAHLIPVTEVCKIPKEELFHTMNEIEQGEVKPKTNAWDDSKLNVVIPMAGAGSRFAVAGYTFPKPLIEVHGKPMIQVVVENLNMPNARHVFVVQREHLDKYNLEPFLKLLRPNCYIIPVEGITQGAADTVARAIEQSDVGDLYYNDPLLIANSDQFLEWNPNEVMYEFNQPNIDGGIVTFEATHPKWSYVELGDNGLVKRVAEKQVISNHATCGVYYVKTTGGFYDGIMNMMHKNIRVNNEFYVAPVFNELIEWTYKIKTKDISKMWGLGDPESLRYFIENYKGKL